MRQQPKNADEKRDWRISATLGAVWAIALTIVYNSDIGIPSSMLLIATVFFVLLIPAMNDLVRSLERFFAGRPDSDGRKSGSNSE